MRFSERIGVSSPKLLQLEGMDDDLRSLLWNVVRIFCLKTDRFKDSESTKRVMWIHFFKKKIDELDDYDFEFYEYVYDWFQATQWWNVYDFIEFLVDGERFIEDKDRFISVVNDILKREVSGYRLIGLHFAPITTEIERGEVDLAILHQGRFEHVSDHLLKAVKLISDRKNPDYENAIKESISAVEAVCREISGNQRATLGDAIREIEKSHNIHAAFREAISKLYGYTNDRGGVRHASKGVVEADFTEAKFMVVTCSAISNFIIEKYSKKVDEK